MICKSKEELEGALGAMITSDHLFYDKMKPYIVNANSYARNQFMGHELYDLHPEFDELLKGAATQMVALRAFYEAIPYIDLTITATGIAVTNNASLAPASEHRIERLRKQVMDSYDRSIDSLIEGFISSPTYRRLFQLAPLFKVLTNSLIFLGRDLEIYAGEEQGSRTALNKLRPEIALAENKLIQFISIEYYNELITKLRNHELTEEDKEALNLARQFIGCFIKGENHYPLGEQLLNYMRANLDKFPTYRESTTYQERENNLYKNKKDDGCYFF